MNMLEIIQAATGEMGLSVPTFIAGNTAPDAVQQLALLNSVGRKLQREYDWQKLIVEYRFNTNFSIQSGDIVDGSAVVTNLSDTSTLSTTFQVVGTGINTDCYIQSVDSATQVTLNQPATATGNYSLNFCQTKYTWPTDFDRLIDRTQWDKTKHWEMMGPETAQEWQWLKSGYIATGPRVRYRQLGGYLQLWPALTSNEYLGMEYVSKNWVMSDGSFAADKYGFTADNDTTFFPDELMIAGLKEAYFLAKGFEAGALSADFLVQKSIAKANDGGSRMLSFAPGYPDVLITPSNIPDSGYGT
jgi:hypothetical protein